MRWVVRGGYLLCFENVVWMVCVGVCANGWARRHAGLDTGCTPFVPVACGSVVRAGLDGWARLETDGGGDGAGMTEVGGSFVAFSSLRNWNWLFLLLFFFMRGGRGGVRRRQAESGIGSTSLYCGLCMRVDVLAMLTMLTYQLYYLPVIVPCLRAIGTPHYRCRVTTVVVLYCTTTN